ncbi:uncharacterized protein LOC144135028 [Amblyomma americanum]
MGTAAEAAFRCLPVVRAVLERLPVEDLFSCARYAELWELVAVEQLSEKLSFFVRLQDDFGHASSDRALVEELRWRLCLAHKARREPASAIIFCSDKQYEAMSLASCFPDDTSVVQVFVPSPVSLQRRGVQKRRAAGLCLLVLFERRPGTELVSECLPGAPCLPRDDKSAFVAEFPNARRRRYRFTGKVTYRHRETGQPARFALYASSAFSPATFRRPPSLYHVASSVLWTTGLKVLKHPPVDERGPPECWGTMLFGEKARATSIKYRASATDLQLRDHLNRVQRSFGDVDNALVLFFQEETVNIPTAEAIWTAFIGAPVVLGTAVDSLALDVNLVPFNLETREENASTHFLEKPVVVAVYGAN